MFPVSRITIFMALCALVGCGASGDSSPTPTQSPPTQQPPAAPPPPSGGGGTANPVWTQGVFEPASTFVNRCEVVRTGVDIEGNAFPDRQGSTLLENFWLRSWTNETYLWNTEVVDRNPANFSNRLDYFAVLKTDAITPSGRPRDEFHFSQPTTEFLAQRNSAPTAGYGARLIVRSATPPRDVRIAFTEPGAPASDVVGGLPNWTRGARILTVDNVDLVNANTQDEVDRINAGLFPATSGESHSFVMQDADGSPPRMVTMVSANIVRQPVNLVRTIPTPGGPVGYIHLTTFSPFSTEAQLRDAIETVRAQGVSDLVLDLRYNGGGLLAVASQLGFMTAGVARTDGRTFEGLRFNAAAGSRNPVTGEPNTPIPFFRTGLGFSVPNGVALPTLNLPRLFILSTDETCSASESVINGLRGVDVEIVLIGGLTCGKPFGFFPTDNCGETYFTTQFQGINDKGFGDFADGFAPANITNAPFAVKTPGCAVADDLTRPLGAEDEAMLAAALQFRATGACPAPPVASATVATVGEPGLATMTSDLTPAQIEWERSRDMRLSGDSSGGR